MRMMGQELREEVDVAGEEEQEEVIQMMIGKQQQMLHSCLEMMTAMIDARQGGCMFCNVDFTDSPKTKGPNAISLDPVDRSYHRTARAAEKSPHLSIPLTSSHGWLHLLPAIGALMFIFPFFFKSKCGAGLLHVNQKCLQKQRQRQQWLQLPWQQPVRGLPRSTSMSMPPLWWRTPVSTLPCCQICLVK